MTDGSRILIVEDEAKIRAVLRTSLTAQGFGVTEAVTQHDGLTRLHNDRFDLLLLDLGLPDGDGLDLLDALRAWSDLPVIVLSARGQERDKVRALEKGADDYLSKPFGTLELLARIRANLRRARPAPESEPHFSAGDLRIDFTSRLVEVSGKPIHLTPTEYKLLVALVRHAGKVMTHGQLLHAVWGKRATEQGHYLRIYMQHLRQKLGDDALKPRYIQTETGIGYRFLLISEAT